jgi:hypothetical protein
MDVRDLVGVVLVAGLVTFMVGAVRWRLGYDRPYAESLPLVHRDVGRRRWIHVWMLVAAFVTPAGLAGLATLPEAPLGRGLAAMAAAVYTIGSVAWLVSLAFRLTVVPWAAERTVETGSVPDTFAPFDSWAGALFSVQMLASYAAFVLLGATVLAGDLGPVWSGWLGVGWGALFVAGFVATGSGGPFSPPFWAHAYTGLVGVVLLATSA